MVKGVGIDLVSIERMAKRCADPACAFVVRTFTEGERAEAAQRSDPAQYFAGRFAAKEAAFKAVAHLTTSRTFDCRTVETLGDENGAPRIVPNERLRDILEEAGVSELLVSITNEGGLAAAVVIAQ